MITLIEFLKLFEKKDPTFSEFLKIARVRSGGKITDLKTYMKNRGISKDDIRLLYDHISNRDEYLKRFFDTSLRVTKTDISDKPMPRSHLDNNTLVNYKNIIRNMHFKNILQDTKSGFENLPSYLDVLKDLYLNHIIDYKIITPSALHYIREGRIGSVFSSFYFRASILNPYLVFSLNERVLKGTSVFSPTIGWTSYAYGFAESSFIKEYVGVDVIPDVCRKTADFLKKYDGIASEIFCTPSEKLADNPNFMRKYREHFDTVFFSPPYYELELYPGQNQSTTLYKTYEEWLVGYWLGTMELCYIVLKKGVRSVIFYRKAAERIR